MPFLNWRSETDVQALTGAHVRLQTQLTLTLAPGKRDELLELLRGVFAQPGTELRLELPMGWTLYWKLREGDSRLLLAHPDHESWVGSVSLNELHAPTLLERIASLSSDRQTELSELRHVGAWSGVSNLEVVLRLR